MRKSLLLTVLLSLATVFGVNAQSWQFELSEADGMPGACKGMYWQMTTPVYELEEPTDVIRLTCFSTNNWDSNTGTGIAGGLSYGPNFPCFTISEFRIYDGNGNQIELTEDMFETNALSLAEGSLAALVDGELTTHFHSTYGKGETPMTYHYIQVALPEAVSKFQIQYDTRYYYYYPDPTHIAITPGTEAIPYLDENLVVEEQVTDPEAIQPNVLYLLRGNYFEYIYDEEGWGREIPTRGDAFYHNHKGASLTPSSNSLVYLEDAGDGTYKLRWLKNEHYIAAGASDLTYKDAGWTPNVLNAAQFNFSACDSIEGAMYIKTNNNLYLTQSRYICLRYVNEANIGEDELTYNYAWSIFKATVDNKATVPVLQASIDKAEELMALQGIASEDNGEYEELATEVANAKNMIAEGSASADELLQESATLQELINNYRVTYIYVLSDSIESILDDEEIEFCDANTGWVAGGYPSYFVSVLSELMDESGTVADNPVNSAVVENMISKMVSTLESFYASVVSTISEFPIRITEEDGLTASAQVSNRWEWTSPVYYLSEPTDVLRMTVFQNSSGETASGTPFFCLGEFILLNELGEQIELTEDMFSTNSLQTNDGGGLAALCDGDRGTYYHGCYSPNETNGSFAPAEGKYAYIQIALNEPISAFSYNLISRQNSNDYYKHTPLDFAFTAGEEIEKPEEGDPFNTVRGEKITDASQIVPGDLYLMWGNLNVLDTLGNVVGEGTGYYNGSFLLHGKKVSNTCVVTFEDAGDGKFYLRNVSANTYLKTPDNWSAASTTYFKEEAAALNIINSTNLAETFKIYHYGPVTVVDRPLYGEGDIYYMVQAWSSDKIGMYSIATLDDDDKDGESDWSIYKVSVDDYNKLDLSGVIATVESYGFDESWIGEAVGMYKSTTLEPVLNPLAKAKAAYDSGDDAACKSSADELRAIVGDLAAIKDNYIPVISGQDYVIRSANKEFKPYHGDDCKLSMFIGPSNGSGARDSENMLWWTYEYSEGMDSAEFHFTFVEDTTSFEGQEEWGKFTIKNVAHNEYIVPEISYGLNITTDEYSSSDAAPLIYLRPRVVGQYALVGVDAWHQETWPTYSYFETRTGGGPYGTSGKAHYGRVATWAYSANTAQWSIIPVSTLTSINNLVIDEPEGDVVSVSYYTPAGMASNVPVKGVNIVKMVYANGVVESKKIFVK